jgi:hypothetical protein
MCLKTSRQEGFHASKNSSTQYFSWSVHRCAKKFARQKFWPHNILTGPSDFQENDFLGL